MKTPKTIINKRILQNFSKFQDKMLKLYIFIDNHPVKCYTYNTKYYK